MNISDLSNLKKSLQTVVAAFEAKEKFLINPLATRMVKAAHDNPGDQAIHAMANFLQRRAEKDTFISRGELNDVYNKIYSVNSRCFDYLEKELGARPSLPEPKKMVHDEKEGTLISNAKIDQGLVNALTSVLDKKAEYKPYSDELAKSAKRSCLKELSSFAFKPASVEVVSGDHEFLLCDAAYETPKGKAHVLIPIEVQNNNALLPSVFVSTAGIENLNEESLKSYLLNSVGKRFTVNAESVLSILKLAKHGVVEPISEVERIVIKANASKGTPAIYDPNAILNQQIDDENPTLETSADPEEVELFAKKLASPKGLAEITFGTSAVNAGREMLRKAVASFGYKNSQVSVNGVDKDSVYYVVAVSGGPGFKVPVKFANGLPQHPEIALADGKIQSFDHDGIKKLLSANDYNIAANASQLYGVKPSELIEVVKNAMIVGDLDKAEDALNVLAASGDQNAFRYAFEICQDVLNNKENIKTASIQKCSKQIKHSASKYVICGHTNLPLHKVYQDEHGDCHPLYRKHLGHTGEGGMFLAHKILG